MINKPNDIFIFEEQSSGRVISTGYKTAPRRLCTRWHSFWQTTGLSLVCVLLVFLFTLVVDSYPLQAGMYVCRDQSGAVSFTNVRNGSDCQPLVLPKGNGSVQGLSRRSFHGADNSKKYDRVIGRIASRYNVDPSLIKAIVHTESNFNSQAISKSGAQGLMQLMPGTARELRVVDPFNPRENIDGGTRYFRQLLDSFNEDLILSLAAYNAGPGLVTRTGGVPQIPETVRYINKVLKRYKVYKATWKYSSPG